MEEAVKMTCTGVFSAADGLIISMAERPLPQHMHLRWMKFSVLCQGHLALFERRDALYFPGGLSSPSQVGNTVLRRLLFKIARRL